MRTRGTGGWRRARGGALVGVAVAALCAAAVAAPGIRITVDDSRKFQTIDGFGTAVYMYMSPVPFEDPRLREMYANDLGATLVRCELSPEVLAAPVENPEEISWRDFSFAKAQTLKANLDFIQAVIKLNPQIRFTPSVWSPPGWMKSNNRSAGGGFLLPKYYPHFAKYLAEWCKYVKNTYGVDIYALSPQNELAFNEFYNSCIYTPAQFRDVLIEIARRFKSEGITTKLFGPEDMTDAQRTPMFIRAVMEDPQARDSLSYFASHGYSDGVQPTGGQKENSLLWQTIAHYDRPLWMTETSGDTGLWTDGALKVKGNARKGALSGVACGIHNSLVYGQVSAWIYWQYVGDKDPTNVYDMVYVKMGRSKSQAKKAEVAEIHPSKKYDVHKHWARFVRPGAQRIEAGPDGQQNVLVSAFEHAADKTLSIVLVNPGTEDATVVLDLKTGLSIPNFDIYRTSASEDCEKVGVAAVSGRQATLVLPARSLVTLAGKEGR